MHGVGRRTPRHPRAPASTTSKRRPCSGPRPRPRVDVGPSLFRHHGRGRRGGRGRGVAGPVRLRRARAHPQAAVARGRPTSATAAASSGWTWASRATKRRRAFRDRPGGPKGEPVGVLADEMSTYRTTQIYEVNVHNPAEDLPRLKRSTPMRERSGEPSHPLHGGRGSARRGASRARPRSSRAGTPATGQETGRWGRSLAARGAAAKSFGETVRDYLGQELIQHDETGAIATCDPLSRGLELSEGPRTSGSPMIPATHQAIRFPVVQGRAGNPLRRVAALDALGRQRQRQVEHLRRGHVRPVRPPPRRQSERPELINKESSTLAVEFDFTIDKQLYRVKRTVPPAEERQSPAPSR